MRRRGGRAREAHGAVHEHFRIARRCVATAAVLQAWSRKGRERKIFHTLLLADTVCIATLYIFWRGYCIDHER